MESTGVYWKPVWNVLEEHFQMVLANAQHIKAVPGRKTDMMDCQWIAELLRHGLLRGSYVPPPIIRDLRDLTRTRATLSQEQSSISSRIQKVLESANIKLASTVTHTMGKSGRAMLDAIISGEDSPERLADLALGKLRSKIPQLQLALQGRVRDHHRFLLDSLLRQFRFLEAEIQALEARLEQMGQQHQELADAVARWITIPGVERVAAWSLVAEIGSDMASFPDASHLASWATRAMYGRSGCGLTRPLHSTNLTFDVSERIGGKNMTDLKFDKEITALLVIDPYNDFISEGGRVSLRPFDGLSIVIH
jgi:transposase